MRTMLLWLALVCWLQAVMGAGGSARDSGQVITNKFSMTCVRHQTEADA